MGIFDFLSKDLTDAWKPSVKEDLVFNLADCSLNNLKIGDKKDQISKFGKPDNKKPYQNDLFQYQDNGLIIETEERKISSFSIILSPDNFSKNFTGTELSILLPSSNYISVNAETSKTHLIEKLNLPVTETDEDEEEIIDYLQSSQYTIEIESEPTGKVKRINIYKS